MATPLLKGTFGQADNPRSEAVLFMQSINNGMGRIRSMDGRYQVH